MVSQVFACILVVHQAILFLAKRPRTQTPRVRVVCVADTHSKTVPVPDGDILIHAGDLSSGGSLEEIQAAVDWLASLPHAHKAVICGNADLFFDEKVRLPQDRHLVKDGASAIDCIKWGNVVFLQRSHMKVDIHGNNGSRSILIYGDPYVPHCGEVDAFQYDLDVDFWKDTVPEETSIVVSHTPSKYYVDDWLGPSEGCPSLLRELARIKPALHVCGHVHPASGRTRIWWSTRVQGAYTALAERAEAVLQSNALSQAVQLFIPATRLLLVDVWEAVRSWFVGEIRVTEAVNAACASDDGKAMTRLPRVVYI